MSSNELWYDSIKTSAQMELMCLEEPSLVAYNYGEDLQVLREQVDALGVVLAQARKVADTAGTFSPWACGEASARRQVGRLKEAIKEFDNE